MTVVRTLWSRLAAVLRRRRLERRLDEEVRLHLDLLATEYERGGLAPDDARFAARRAFGGVEQMKERHRDRRGFAWLEDLRRDLQHSLRSLARAPVFAAAAVLTLAFGMSALAGMLTIMNTFMFRPLPVSHPEELVSISVSDSHGPFPHGLSFLDLQDYRTESGVLVDALGYTPRLATLNVGNGSDRLTIEQVTDNYFSMLGVEPGAGRLIRAGEARVPGEAPVLVLSWDYWQSRLGGDPSIVGRSVRVNGQPFTIIGITPPSFSGTEALFRVDGYVPVAENVTLSRTGPSLLDDRGRHSLFVLGRLRPGVTLAQARAALGNVAAELARRYPVTNTGATLTVVPEPQARPNPSMGPFFRVATTAMAALAIVLVLIMSANVANLLVARAAGRGREVALRTALGAGRSRIVRQLMTESVMLAVLGGIVAVPIAMVAVRALSQIVANGITMVTIDPDLRLDATVLVSTLVVAAVAGVAAGVAPAILACRTNLAERLKAGGRDAIAAPGSRFRGALVVAQVGLSLALLVSGGLFVRSLASARQVDLGFEPRGMFLATASPGLVGYDQATRIAFYESVRDRLAALPGVDGAAWISTPPLGIIMDLGQVSPDGRRAGPDWQPLTVSRASISPDYLDTARIPLLEGRPFDERDGMLAPGVSIVNEDLARQFWPGQSAVGRQLTVGDVETEVVGVAGNGKYRTLSNISQGMVFRPVAQDTPTLATVAVRSSRSPTDLAVGIRQVIREVDPDVAVYDVRSMADHLDSGSAFLLFRLGAMMASIFGGMGALLAAIGLYGVMAFQVSQRTREIGVRMAMGARTSMIVGGVLGRAARLAAIGIGVGAVLAGGLAYVLRPVLVGVSPFDPLTYSVVAGGLVAVCLLASFVPAFRATSIDPIAALRAE